jgi:hypothetical protein
MRPLSLVLFALTLSVSVESIAAWETKCGTVKRVFSWAQGSDKYGIRATLVSNPASCTGFYVDHDGSNKQYVYSALLASATSGMKACVQYDPNQTKHDGMCRLNYIYVEAN